MICYIHRISFLSYYVLLLDGCSYQYNAEKGLFSTVGFPDDYAENSNCSWEITVPEGQKVQLTFHLLNVSLKTTSQLTMKDQAACTFVCYPGINVSFDLFRLNIINLVTGIG